MNENVKIIDEDTKLDRIVLINCEILVVEDVETLAEFNIVKVPPKQTDDNETTIRKSCYTTLDGQEFEYLKIEKEGSIDVLKAGVTNFGKQFCTLELSVNKGLTRNFEGNTLDEYVEQLTDIQNYLIDNYGILIDFSNARLKSVEINRTFKIEYPFDEYSRPIQLILSQMPYMKKISVFADVDKGKITHETFSAWNKKSNLSKNKEFKKIIFYNKSEQLETRGFLICDNFMRFEIKVFGERNIEKCLKAKYFINLTQNDINRWFSEQVDTLIVKPMEKWQKARDKQIKTILKEELKKGGTWVINALRRFTVYELENETPLILDICQIYPVIDKLEIDDKSRVKNRFLQQSLKYERIFTCNNSDKLAEIINKLIV